MFHYVTYLPMLLNIVERTAPKIETTREKAVKNADPIFSTVLPFSLNKNASFITQ